MHVELKQPLPEPAKGPRYAILNLKGEEVDSRPAYWTALMRGYMTLRNGNFTVERRDSWTTSETTTE